MPSHKDLGPKTAPLKTRQRVFEEPQTRIFTPAVALVDAEGSQTGTAEDPLAVSQSGDVMVEILRQLQILNLHLQQITNETFEEI